MVQRGSNRIACALAACLIVLFGRAPVHGASPRRAVLDVTNPTGIQRPEEVLEVPLGEIKARLAQANPEQSRSGR